MTFGSAVHAESIKDCLEGDIGCAELDGHGELDSNQTNATTPQEAESTGSLIWKLIQMVLALGFILVLIYGLLYLLNKRSKTFSKVQTLENMGGISIGQNKSMQIVRIGKQYFVVGVGDNVQLLHEITDEDVKKQLIQSGEQSTERQFNHLLPGFKKKQAQQSSTSFKSLFAKELEQMKNNRQHIINEHKDERHE